MESKNNSGQEAIEFILITVLVFFASLGVILVFGNKIAAFFHTDSSVAKVANNTIAVVNPDVPGQYTPDYDTIASVDNNKQLYDDYQTQITEEETTTTTTTITTGNTTISNYDVAISADGSASFTVGAQQVTLPPELLKLQSDVVQASGSSGMEDVVDLLAYMIDTHKDEYPGASVPIKISYGSSQKSFYDTTEGWSASNPETLREGSASAAANMVMLQVGDHVVVFENDQANAYGTSCIVGESCGKYRIEGTVSGNTLNATITSGDDSYLNNKSISLNMPAGGTSLNGTLNSINYYDNDDRKEDANPTDTGSLTWKLDFSDPDKTFTIE